MIFFTGNSWIGACDTDLTPQPTQEGLGECFTNITPKSVRAPPIKHLSFFKDKD
jgi:hypothetical protein